MSIFEPIYNDGGDTIYLLDQVADKKEMREDKDTLILLQKALEKIKERERNVLRKNKRTRKKCFNRPFYNW